MKKETRGERRETRSEFLIFSPLVPRLSALRKLSMENVSGIVRITIRYAGMLPWMHKREYNLVQREAYRDIGNWWFKTCLPKHFTRAGGKEYGYLPRAGEPGNERKNFRSSYSGYKKLNKKAPSAAKEMNPLVLTGEARARATGLCDVRPTGKGVKIVIHANKLNWRNKHSKIHMNEEVRTVSRQEEVAMILLFNRSLQVRLKAADAMHLSAEKQIA
jgi:hypothetical protein